ncbi:MAG: hypothetical protein ACP5C4_04565 [Methanomicrobiales archaeon]
MRYRGIAAAIILIAVMAAIAGCAGTPEESPAPTPTAQTPAPTVTATADLSPGPTQTMPPGSEVEVTISRDPIQPTITATFAGGAGQSRVTDVLVRVTRSDGQVITEHLENNLDSSVTIEGTRGSDRVEVTVSLTTGNSYTIYDKVLTFKSHQ